MANADRILMVCIVQALLQLTVLWIAERATEDVNSSLLALCIIGPVIAIFQIANCLFLQFIGRKPLKRRLYGAAFTILFSILFLFSDPAILYSIILAGIFATGNTFLLLNKSVVTPGVSGHNR